MEELHQNHHWNHHIQFLKDNANGETEQEGMLVERAKHLPKTNWVQRWRI